MTTACDKLRETDVVICDEFSMLTNQLLNIAVMRIHHCTPGTRSKEMALSRKLFILVGDPAQLPPVCKTHKNDAHVCRICHIANGVLWRAATHHTLTSCHRQASDPQFLKFLQRIRVREPSQRLLNNTLRVCQANICSLLDAMTARMPFVVLCKHNSDVNMYNSMAFSRLFCHPSTPSQTAQAVHLIQPTTNAPPAILATNREAAAWAEGTADAFHTLPFVAVGARVILDTNLDISRGAVNGAMGTVSHVGLSPGPPGADSVKSITVRLDSTGQDIIVRKMQRQTRTFSGMRYYRATFPLSLGYALTGHRSQGATYSCLVFVHVRSAFCPGLLYVMLSRATSRANLRLLSHLTS